MASNIILPKDFDNKNVGFSGVRMLDNGGKIIYMSYNNAPLIFQTPQMAVPFGLSKWDNDGKAVPKYTLDLSFKGMDKSASIAQFFDVLKQLDTRLVEEGFTNQSTWFKGKKYNSKEIVEALYTPLVKYAKDKDTGDITDKYPPTFKVTVPFKDGKFACDVYDDTRNLVDITRIETKGSKCTAIIQCMGLWFAGGKFGSSWRVIQMKVVPSATIRGYAFHEVKEDIVDDDDQDEDAPATDPQEVMELAVDKPPTDNDSDDSSDVEDDDDIDRPASAPAKKVVYRRKK
jgi:hypothetical protein